MSRRRVEKYATNSATRADATRPKRSASQRFGGEDTSNAAAAPYMPRPKNAEWPNETMPVSPIRMSDDIANSPQIRIAVRNRREHAGNNSGAVTSNASTALNATQEDVVR